MLSHHHNVSLTFCPHFAIELNLLCSFVIPTFSAWALISSNTAGRTKRTIMSSMTFIAYCAGNIGKRLRLSCGVFGVDIF